MNPMIIQEDELEKELSLFTGQEEQQEQQQEEQQEQQEDVEETSLLPSNVVDLFGPGVSQFWNKKKNKKKRIRRGLTKGKKLPEHVERLLGNV